MLRTETQVAALLSEVRVRIIERCIDKSRTARTEEEQRAWQEVAATLPDIFAEAGSDAIRTKGL